jgi:hypothetical protein
MKRINIVLMFVYLILSISAQSSEKGRSGQFLDDIKNEKSESLAIVPSRKARAQKIFEELLKKDKDLRRINNGSIRLKPSKHSLYTEHNLNTQKELRIAKLKKIADLQAGAENG